MLPDQRRQPDAAGCSPAARRLHVVRRLDIYTLAEDQEKLSPTASQHASSVVDRRTQHRPMQPLGAVSQRNVHVVKRTDFCACAKQRVRTCHLAGGERLTKWRQAALVAHLAGGSATGNAFSVDRGQAVWHVQSCCQLCISGSTVCTLIFAPASRSSSTTFCRPTLCHRATTWLISVHCKYRQQPML